MYNTAICMDNYYVTLFLHHNITVAYNHRKTHVFDKEMHHAKRYVGWAIIVYTQLYWVAIYSPAMIIGFSRRRQFISESDAPPGTGAITLLLDIRSLRISERDHHITFYLTETCNTTVEAYNTPFGSQNIDALFGQFEDDIDSTTIKHLEQLNFGRLTLEHTVTTTVINDFYPENLECYDIRILELDAPNNNYFDTFSCNDDAIPATEDFFCVHTICIEDDDG